MSAIADQLSALQAEVARLESASGLDRDEIVQKALSEKESAVARAEAAEHELNRLKAAMDWTMQGLQIRDLLRTTFKGEEFPASAEGFLPFNYEPEDTKRLEWINRHGRVGGGDTGFFIVLPVANMHAAAEQGIPDIYNIRCMIDTAMRLQKQGEKT